MKPLRLTGQVFVDGKLAGWTGDGVLEFDEPREPVPAVFADKEVRIVRGGQVVMSFQPPQQYNGRLSWDVVKTMFGVGGEPPRSRVVFDGHRPVPLKTGRLAPWTRRVDHARALRLATWKRRRQRRHGVPAASIATCVLIPTARVDVSAAS